VGEVVLWPRRHLLDSGKTPSTYGGRLAAQCHTVSALLELREASDAEAQKVWKEIAARAAARQDIGDIVDRVLAGT